MSLLQFANFLTGYIEAAEWTENCKLTTKEFAQATEDCKDFWKANHAMLEPFDAAQSGHDFWLTRNRHGAGFWDGDYPEDVGKALTDAAHVYGSVYLENTKESE